MSQIPKGFNEIFDELREILHTLRRIEGRLRPRFHLHIRQKYVVGWGSSGVYFDQWSDHSMSIQQGSTGTFLGVVTASDSSAVTTSAWSWAASDPAVTIANNPSDSTGATVDVTVPASDTDTTFTLTAKATAESPSETTPQVVTDSTTVTVTAAPVPVTFSMKISQTK